MTKTKRAADPRPRRTIGALQRALVELTQTGPPSTIDITELCRVAGVHRTTFYKHFTDVSELAGTVVEDLLDHIDSAPAPGSYRTWLGELLEHVAERRAVYAPVLGRDGDPAVVRRVCDRLVHRTAQLLGDGDPCPHRDEAFCRTLAFAAYGLIEAVIADENLDGPASVDATVARLPGALRREDAA
ncbi:TetR/AcrR family transcriptional regulator [Georgenia yuyongxinii]|uniref:TetR/AcrR family transcriptional regulator n=1 Tax=Georgenia yuyongxinii TaxID=2589797 RepID=A0A5B8C7D7_9MICO|nr:TetR/AcrR family transcriptional regulator [Georgenia yuyongxinii]QDC26368.1 TetR/AcrR family transcriptional regulator [Georgenia yuyongxinii]